MSHHNLDPYPIPQNESPLYINEPWLIDKSLLEYPIHPEPEEQDDNVRIYVPLDLNREAILRRLRTVISRYGEAGEYNELDFSVEVGMLISQIEIYDQIWFVRNHPDEGTHSPEVISLISDFISELKSIPDAGAELFPFETIDELRREYLGIDSEYDDEEEYFEDDFMEDDFGEDDVHIYTWDYRPDDDILEAAFAYKKTKLWTKLYDTELFALKYPDGDICYVSIMGRLGEHNAVAVYPGEKGYASYRSVLDRPVDDALFCSDMEVACGMDCIQLVLDNKEYLMPDEEQAVRDYASAHDINLRGRYSFPHIQRFTPGHIPWFPTDELDRYLLLEAVKAAIYVSNELQSVRNPAKMGFCEVTVNDSIPLISITDNGYSMGRISLPKESFIYYPQADHPDEQLIKRIRKIKKRTTIECKIISGDAPVYTQDSEAPVLPYILFAVNHETGFAYLPIVIPDYLTDPDSGVNKWIENMLAFKVNPDSIYVDDDRTYELIVTAASAMGAELKKTSYLEHIYDVIGGFYERDEFHYPDDAEDMEVDGIFDDPGELLRMFESMADKPVEYFEALPPFIREDLRDVILEGILPTDIENKFRKKLKM